MRARDLCTTRIETHGSQPRRCLPPPRPCSCRPGRLLFAVDLTSTALSVHCSLRQSVKCFVNWGWHHAYASPCSAGTPHGIPHVSAAPLAAQHPDHVLREHQRMAQVHDTLYPCMRPWRSSCCQTDSALAFAARSEPAEGDLPVGKSAFTIIMNL